MRICALISLACAAAATGQCGWTVEPGGVGSPPTGWGVRAAAIYRGDLYLGGDFAAPVPWIARRQGQTFVPVGGGVPGEVHAMLVYQDRLVTGGRGGVRSWDGAAWSVVGATVGFGDVDALCEWNGDLYAGGLFSSIGGVTASKIARWDGKQWASVGSGLSSGLLHTSVQSLCVFDGNLVAGGSFNLPTVGIARWDGTNWSPFGGGLFALEAPQVLAVREYHGQFYAGGIFQYALGTGPMRAITRWNGAAWQQVGGPGSPDAVVHVLAVWRDQLVAAGSFIDICGVPAQSIAMWNGSAWTTPNGGGLQGGGNALLQQGDDLLVAGYFLQAGGQSAQHWAVYGGCACYADCNTDGALNLADFGCFQTRFALADPYVDCNHDGVRSLADFGCFTTKFALGCP